MFDSDLITFKSVCSLALLNVSVLFSSGCRPSRRVSGCRRSRSAGRNYVNFSRGSRTTTPAACLASHASPMTTITGRPPPSGQVRNDMCLWNVIWRTLWKLFYIFQRRLDKNNSLDNRCTIHLFSTFPPPFPHTPLLFFPQWVRSVHAPVPTTTHTGASGPSMTRTTSCSVNLLLVSWSILTSTLTHTRYFINSATHNGSYINNSPIITLKWSLDVIHWAFLWVLGNQIFQGFPEMSNALADILFSLFL